jgi:hypothetical protein
MEDIKQTNQRRKDKSSVEELLIIQREALASKVRSIGIDNLLNKEYITASQDEIREYIAFTEKSKSDRKIGDAKVVETINYLLETFEYEEKNRLRLEKGRETFEYSSNEKERDEKWNKTFYADIEKRAGKDAVEKIKVDLKKRNKERLVYRSTRVVENWKMNKALLDKYGGRIIFQQFGIEPIDAYQALIEDIKTKGQLKIMKPDYDLIFAEQEAYNKSISHNFIPKDSFSTPYWELEKIQESYEETIRHYKSIPHK